MMRRLRLWTVQAFVALVAGWVVLLPLSVTAAAETAEWIWAAEHDRGAVPQTACHFRKQFMVSSPESGEITIAADDRYELYLNGRRIGTGESTQTLDRYDISNLLRGGLNLVAVRVSNTEGSTAALAARVLVKDRTSGQRSFSTDASWLTSLRPLPFWFTFLYNDTRWTAAAAYGKLGETTPWDKADSEEPTLASKPTPEPPASDSPATPPDDGGEEEPRFVVEEVLNDKATGSLIAMTFNEFGHVIASRDGGELLSIRDSNRDNVVEDVKVCCDQVKNCQGILCLNGHIYVCGQGPDGQALYQLSDRDHDGQFEQVRTLLSFDGEGSEYGVHGVTLGVDGYLYVVVGSKAQPKPSQNATDLKRSPYRDFYEGSLVSSRDEDPDGEEGHGKAPGGTILRIGLDGKSVQRVAGGLRNAYDLAFNREGDLFTHDGDAEADLGAPWYRPTAVYHVPAGAEFGWRSGSAKWPEHFVDRLPVVLDTARGAPTGLTFYNHYKFPEEYQNGLFVADWAHGRIYGVKLKRSGSSYTANSELFVNDPSLHVTDMSVGPDGCLYFVTGGRGMPGGLHRIRWTGKSPPGSDNLGEGLSAAIRQPQLDSAWARQQIAALKKQMGDEWNRMVPGVAHSDANPWYYRTRALDLMQLYGPTPTTDLLVRLAKAENEHVRAKAAELMGLHANAVTGEALTGLLGDADRLVRRKACESLVRAGQLVPVDKLTELLKSDDRFEAWAARRLLERMPPAQWRDKLIGGDDHRLMIQGSLALMIAHPSKEHARLVLDRFAELASQFVTDRDFTDMLRVVQVALHRGQVAAEEVPRLRELLSEEFPSSDRQMNRDLVRLLAYLQVSTIADRYLEYLKSESVPEMDKLHLALHLRFIEEGWNVGGRIQVLEFLEAARSHHRQDAFGQYVTKAGQEFAKLLTEEEVITVISEGAHWPNAAFALLYRMPEKVDRKTRDALTKLDEQLAPRTDVPSLRLKVGVVAVLARSGDPQSLAYLRNAWDRDPERRPAIAIGLALWPSTENWGYLVRSLSALEGDAVREVLAKLSQINLAPEHPEYYRQVILRGLELGDQGAEDAIALLEHWTGEPSRTTGDWKDNLAAWQKWYRQTWPDHLEAVPVKEPEQSKWKYKELLGELTGEKAHLGSAEKGLEVFATAGCAKCHRFGDRGEDAGPDLTSVGGRLMRKAILRSILHPSHVIADPYLAKTVITKKGRVYVGRISPSPEADKVVIVQTDGTWITLDKEEIEEAHTQRASSMPAGLLESLSSEEIADLFAYLKSAPEPLLARQPDDQPAN